MKNGRDSMEGFFSFKTMFIVPFVKSVYFLVFVVINVCAFVLFLDQFVFHIKMIPGIGILERHPFWWPFLFLAIHLFWRLFCEGVLVVFRIYEMLVSIEWNMEEGGMVELTKDVEPEMLPQKIGSRKEFKRWWRDRKLRRSLNRQEKEPDVGESDNVG